MEYKYQAVVLSKIDIAETDRIYTAFTKEAGKIRMVAKGVRKPNAKLAGSLEPITHSEIFLARARGNGKITGAIGADNFLYLKENITALEKVFYALKIFDRLISEEEQDEKTFDLLLSFLTAMDELVRETSFENPSGQSFQSKLDILTLGFIFKLFFLLGYGLEARKCVDCFGKITPGNNYFSAQKGGVLCASCAGQATGKVKITDAAVKFIRVFEENKMKNLIKIKAEKNNLDNLKIVLNEAVRWIAE